MRWGKTFGALGIALLLASIGLGAARARAASDLWVACDNAGQVGQPFACNASALDGNGDDDPTFRGTITFTSTFTNNFTVTPHDPGHPTQYTFKAGDLQPSANDGIDFAVVFGEPGNGTISVTSGGLSSTTDPFTISAAPASATTTTVAGSSPTTTAPPTSTSVPSGSAASVSGQSTTTTTRNVTTTTIKKPVAVLAATVSRAAMAKTGQATNHQAAIALGLFVIGVLMAIASAGGIRRGYRGKHFS